MYNIKKTIYYTYIIKSIFNKKITMLIYAIKKKKKRVDAYLLPHVFIIFYIKVYTAR